VDRGLDVVLEQQARGELGDLPALVSVAELSRATVACDCS
jgi:hypothetical protein